MPFRNSEAPDRSARKKCEVENSPTPLTPGTVVVVLGAGLWLANGKGWEVEVPMVIIT